MTNYPKIENFDDYRIKNRKYSQYKLLNEFFTLPCDKTKDNLLDYLQTCLGLSARPKTLNLLIKTLKNEGLIKISHNGIIELTDLFPKCLRDLHKAIEKFEKKREDYFNALAHSPLPNDTEQEEANGDVNK
jgi:hypothetical protein